MDMTRVSVSTFPYRDKDVDEALVDIAAAGFEKVDLLGAEPHFSLDEQKWNPRRARAHALDHGLKIANLATYVGGGFGSEDENARQQELEKVQRAIDLAVAVGARSIRVFRGPKEYDDPSYIPRMAPWFRKAAEYASEKYIYMGVENHGGGISGSPEACLELCRQVGSPYFGILYDPCNLLRAGTDYKQALKTLREHIVHVHLKDGTSDPDSQKTTMLGEGDIDVYWLVKQLDEIGYGGDIAVEYEVETVPPDKGLLKWYDYLAALEA
ncbi:MAG: sugar phosphate isomerase/epimerase family protein [Phycisphaerae bacterium]